MDCNKGPDSDKPAFAAWVRELKMAFREHGFLLSAAVSPSKKVIDAGYDVPEINKYLDWIAVMTYDFHGHWDKKTGHVSPFEAHPEDDYDYFNTVSMAKLHSLLCQLKIASCSLLRELIICMHHSLYRHYPWLCMFSNEVKG